MSVKKIILILILTMQLITDTVLLSNAEIKSAESLETLAVVLVVDTSGSMLTTDPRNLRGTAANIFTDLLSPEDYMGIITFNTSVEVAQPMVTVKNSENKYSIKEKLVPKLIPSGDTNYQLALSEAGKQLTSLNNGNVRKVILFLTDGKPDPDPKKADDKVFMNDYMNSLWKTVSSLALSQYPVYTVGFSEDINPQILQKISYDTRGEYQGINDSAVLASSFFKILCNLKNRNDFLNAEWNVKEEKNFEFEMDESNSQVTLVFTYIEENPMEISLVPPKEKFIDPKVVSVNKTAKYTMITLNQTDKELAGKWSVYIKGNGTVKAFGAKDLFTKTWLEKPLPNSIHSVNVPIEIEASITGAQNEQPFVEALIKKNGIEETHPILLKYKNGKYQGVYDKTDQAGIYDIQIKVYQDNKMVSSNNYTVFIKALPTLETDFHADNKNFLLGSDSIVTSWLNMNGIIIKPSIDLRIDNYQMLLNYTDGTKEILPLYDNGNSKYGDILSKDGIFSNKLEYAASGKTKATLMVKGVFKGENFLLEKPLGTYQIYPPGTISLKIDTENLYGRKGDIIKIPFVIKNTSAVTELINLSVNKSYGRILDAKVSADPSSITNTTVSFQINENLKKGIQEIPIKLNTEEPLTKLEANQINMNIQVVSGLGWIVNKVLDKIVFLILLFSIPLLIVLIGLLLHRLFVYPKTIVQGRLCFYESSDLNRIMKEFNLKSLKKSIVVISLSKDKAISDYQAFTSGYNYNILLINLFEKGKWKFIEGYKALGKPRKTSNLVLRTTEPGIFQYEGSIYTKKELHHGDIFETGGYTFQYFEHKKRVEDAYCKDLLEGKI